VETLARKSALADGVLDGVSGLDTQMIGSGRQAFLRQVAAVVRVPQAADRSGPRPSVEALRAVDPELGFAAVLAERLGDRLVSCEMCLSAHGGVVLLVVVEGDTQAVSVCAERICSDWLGDPSQGLRPVVDVVGRHEYETVNRLVVRGVLTWGQGTVRTLYRRGDGLASPKLAVDGEKARVQTLRRQALEAYRQARQLLASLAFDAARQPLERAVVALACAHAVQKKMAEPQNVSQALAAPFTGLWGDTLPVLGELLERDGSPVAVSRALMPRFGG